MLARFRDERDWQQFHKPKDIAEALSVEASELLELFMWKSHSEIAEKLEKDPDYRKHMEDELADVFSYCLVFANALGWDVTELFFRKTKEVAAKYPVEKVRGSATKYSELT